VGLLPPFPAGHGGAGGETGCPLPLVGPVAWITTSPGESSYTEKVGKLEVFSLPADDLDPFLDRRRYSVFSLSQLQFSSFLTEILIKANDFVPSSAARS